MTSVIRPLSRGILHPLNLSRTYPLITPLASGSRRTLHLTAVRGYQIPGPATHASTALQPKVKEKEERESRSIVGETGKGTEGVHFQGKLRLPHSRQQPM